MADDSRKVDNDDGMTYGTLIVALVLGVALFFTVTISLYMFRQQSADYMERLHIEETRDAYRFTWIKNVANQLQDDCKAEKSKNERTVNWLKQNHPSVKLPSELLSETSRCAMPEQMPEFKEAKEEH